MARIALGTQILENFYLKNPRKSALRSIRIIRVPSVN
jgi:hypothetical protein